MHGLNEQALSQWGFRSLEVAWLIYLHEGGHTVLHGNLALVLIELIEPLTLTLLQMEGEDANGGGNILTLNCLQQLLVLLVDALEIRDAMALVTHQENPHQDAGLADNLVDTGVLREADEKCVKTEVRRNEATHVFDV